MPRWLKEVSTSARLLLFKPGFGVDTGWAYGRMVERGTDYIKQEDAEAAVTQLLDAPDLRESLLINNMEDSVFQKYLCFEALFDRLTDHFGVHPRMSGSGSCCFCLLKADQTADALIQEIQQAWGPEVFFIETNLFTP